MADRMTQYLTGRALFLAVQQNQPTVVLIHHSDRGSQYCARGYHKLIEQFGMMVSMSRTGGTAMITSRWSASGEASRMNWCITAVTRPGPKLRNQFETE